MGAKKYPACTGSLNMTKRLCPRECMVKSIWIWVLWALYGLQFASTSSVGYVQAVQNLFGLFQILCTGVLFILWRFQWVLEKRYWRRFIQRFCFSMCPSFAVIILLALFFVFLHFVPKVSGFTAASSCSILCFKWDRHCIQTKPAVRFTKPHVKKSEGVKSGALADYLIGLDLQFYAVEDLNPNPSSASILC